MSNTEPCGMYAEDHRERNSFQRLGGFWLSTFNQECRKDNFEILEYLGKLAKGNEELN